NLSALLGKMETVTAVIRVTTDVNLELSIGMKDGDAAEEMGKAIDDMLTQVKGFLGFVMDPKVKPVIEVVKSIKSSVKDKNVNITAKLTGAAIGELLKMGD